MTDQQLDKFMAWLKVKISNSTGATLIAYEVVAEKLNDLLSEKDLA